MSIKMLIGPKKHYKYLKLTNRNTPGAVPRFIEGDVFEVIVPLDGKGSEKTGEKTREKTEKTREKASEKTSGKIINLMLEDKFITVPELAKKIKVTERSIFRNISKLKKKGKLKRIGSDKDGQWEVVD